MTRSVDDSRRSPSSFFSHIESSFLLKRERHGQAEVVRVTFSTLGFAKTVTRLELAAEDFFGFSELFQLIGRETIGIQSDEFFAAEVLLEQVRAFFCQTGREEKRLMVLKDKFLTGSVKLLVSATSVEKKNS